MQESVLSGYTSEKPRSGQSVNIEDRKQVSMTGIESVISFSPHEIVLQAVGSRLTVTGEELRIAEFCKTTGKFTATGKISGLRYGSSGKLRAIFR